MKKIIPIIMLCCLIQAKLNAQATICSGDSITLNATNPNGRSLQWQDSTTTAWNDISGATSASRTVSPTQNTFYRLKVMDVNCNVVYYTAKQLVTVQPCVSNKNIGGLAQKGPFLNGSSVTLSELDASFTATGNVFNTQILDNSGAFELNNIPLSSNYVTLRVDGFYFNEVCGALSNAQITLNGIADVGSNTSINLNVLTHLEKARVEYLVGNGSTFSDAKQQAQSEILAIFEITPSSTVSSSELLDISHSSEGDAILIAISSLLQGYRTESEFSDLMSNIITDIRTDGILNSSSLGSQLLAHALLLDTIDIKTNIENRYNGIGISITVPIFGKFISGSINNTSFSNTTTVIDYPSSGTYGDNVLDITDTSYTVGPDYSLAANLPNGCVSLKVKMSRITGTCTNGFMDGCWIYSTNTLNWNVSAYDFATDSQTFTSTGKNCDLNIIFWMFPGTFLIEYFENGSAIPTRTKTITVI